MTQTEAPHTPAAFINAIREEGTKEEACDYLQKQWNENCALRAQLAAAREVKELEWDNTTRHGRRAHVAKEYTVIEYYPNGIVQYCIQRRAYPLNEIEYETLSEAKQAAQADYKRRILAALKEV